MDRRRTAGALLALAACIACSTAAPTVSNDTALDTYDSSQGCYYNFQHYGEGDRIMTNEPCLNCTCHNRMLMCYLRVCPFTKPIGQDCTIEKRADQCCPIITCPDVPVDLLTSTSTTSPAEYGITGVGHLDKYGCSIHGKYYPEGSKVPGTPNKPCEHCYCIRNMTTCVMQECTLHVDGCTPIYNKDVCCPVRYSCDHPDDLPLMLDHMTTTVGTTPGFQWTTTVSPTVSQECIHGDETFPDGALIATAKACEHCYCMKGDIVCVVQECGTPMENEGKNCTSVPPSEGQCCPETYICDGDIDATTDELLTLTPPRRSGVEGSGYRSETDEQITKVPLHEPEVEGSGGFEESTDEPIDEEFISTPDQQKVTETHTTSSPDQQKETETHTTITIDDKKISELTTSIPEDHVTDIAPDTIVPSDEMDVVIGSTSIPEEQEQSTFKEDEDKQDEHETTFVPDIKEAIEQTTPSVISDEKDHEHSTTLTEDQKPIEYTTLPVITDEKEISSKPTPVTESEEPVEHTTSILIDDKHTDGETAMDKKEETTQPIITDDSGVEGAITSTPEYQKPVEHTTSSVVGDEKDVRSETTATPEMHEPIDQTTPSINEVEITDHYISITEKQEPTTVSEIEEPGEETVHPVITDEKDTSTSIPERRKQNEQESYTTTSYDKVIEDDVTAAPEMQKPIEETTSKSIDDEKEIDRETTSIPDKQDVAQTEVPIDHITTESDQHKIYDETTMPEKETPLGETVSAEKKESDIPQPTTPIIMEHEQDISTLAQGQTKIEHEITTHIFTDDKEVSGESTPIPEDKLPDGITTPQTDREVATTSDFAVTSKEEKPYEQTTIPVINENEIIKETDSIPQEHELDDKSTTIAVSHDDEFYSKPTTIPEEQKPYIPDDTKTEEPSIATSGLLDVDKVDHSTEEPDKGLNTVPIEEEDVVTTESSYDKQSSHTEITEKEVDKTTSYVKATESGLTGHEDDVTTNVETVTFVPSIDDGTTLHVYESTEKPHLSTEPQKEYDPTATVVEGDSALVTEPSTSTPSEISTAIPTENILVEDITTIKTTDHKEVETITSPKIPLPEQTIKDITTHAPEISQETTITSISTTLEPLITKLEDESQTTVLPDIITEKPDVNQAENEIGEEFIPSISSPGIIPGEGNCLVDGVTYGNNSMVPSTNKCQLSCKCLSSIVKCDAIHCSPPPENMVNCQPVYDSAESCCPTYVCEHSKETIPPQPHSQMAVTETISPEQVECTENCYTDVTSKKPDLKCNGTQCEVVEDKIVSVIQPDLCTTDSCGAPQTQVPESLLPSAQDTQDTCTDGDCLTKRPSLELTPPSDTTKDSDMHCEGDKCTPVSESPAQDCGSTDCSADDKTKLDSSRRKGDNCKDENECIKPVTTQEKETHCVDEACSQVPITDEGCGEAGCKDQDSLTTEKVSISDISPVMTDMHDTDTETKQPVTPSQISEETHSDTTDALDIVEQTTLKAEMKPQEDDQTKITEIPVIVPEITTYEDFVDSTTESKEQVKIEQHTKMPDFKKPSPTEEIVTVSHDTHITVPLEIATIVPEPKTTMTLPVESESTDVPVLRESTQHPHTDVDVESTKEIQEFTTEFHEMLEETSSPASQLDLSSPSESTEKSPEISTEVKLIDYEHLTTHQTEEKQPTTVSSIIELDTISHSGSTGEHTSGYATDSTSEATAVKDYADTTSHIIEDAVTTPSSYETTVLDIDLEKEPQKLMPTEKDHSKTEHTTLKEPFTTTSIVSEEKTTQKVDTEISTGKYIETTTPYLVELEEHTHKPDAISTEILNIEESIATTESQDTIKEEGSSGPIYETTVVHVDTSKPDIPEVTTTSIPIEEINVSTDKSVEGDKDETKLPTTTFATTHEVMHSTQIIDDEHNTVIPVYDSKKETTKDHIETTVPSINIPTESPQEQTPGPVEQHYTEQPEVDLEQTVSTKLSEGVPVSTTEMYEEHVTETTLGHKQTTQYEPKQTTIADVPLEETATQESSHPDIEHHITTTISETPVKEQGHEYSPEIQTTSEGKKVYSTTITPEELEGQVQRRTTVVMTEQTDDEAELSLTTSTIETQDKITTPTDETKVTQSEETGTTLVKDSEDKHILDVQHPEISTEIAIEMSTEAVDSLSTEKPIDSVSLPSVEEINITTSPAIDDKTVSLDKDLTTKSDLEISDQTLEPEVVAITESDSSPITSVPQVSTILPSHETSEIVSTVKESIDETTKHDMLIDKYDSEKSPVTEELEIMTTISPYDDEHKITKLDSEIVTSQKPFLEEETTTTYKDKPVEEVSHAHDHTVEPEQDTYLTSVDDIIRDDNIGTDAMPDTTVIPPKESSVTPKQEETVSVTEKQSTDQASDIPISTISLDTFEMPKVTTITPAEDLVQHITTIAPSQYDTEKITTEQPLSELDSIQPDHVKPIESMQSSTELQKPDITDKPPVEELPSPDEDTDHQTQEQFPASGAGGYGQEPDYVEEDQAFGPGTCRYGGKVYVSAQQIPRDDPCDFCFCFRSDIICLQQSCPPPIHGCHEEPIQGFCCPRYECPVSMATTVNMTTTTTTTTTTLPPHFLPHAYKGAAQRRGCQIKGHSYQVGEVVRASSGPCLHCTCGGDGQMKCDPKACTPEPMLRQMIAAAVSAKRR